MYLVLGPERQRDAGADRKRPVEPLVHVRHVDAEEILALELDLQRRRVEGAPERLVAQVGQELGAALELIAPHAAVLRPRAEAHERVVAAVVAPADEAHGRVEVALYLAHAEAAVPPVVRVVHGEAVRGLVPHGAGRAAAHVPTRGAQVLCAAKPGRGEPEVEARPSGWPRPPAAGRPGACTCRRNRIRASMRRFTRATVNSSPMSRCPPPRRC